MSFQLPRPDSGLYANWQQWALELLRYLEAQDRLQIERAHYQLGTHPSTDLPSAVQEGQLLFKPDTLRVSVSFSDSWHDLAALDQANEFTATQTISSADAGATVGPVLILDRASTSPAASDVIGGLYWYGRNTAVVPETIAYGLLAGQIRDAGDGTENFQWNFDVIGGGVVTRQMRLSDGLVIGAATGNYKGTGTINVASGYYVNTNLVLGERKAGWSTATGTPTRTSFDTATVTLPQLAERVKALIDDLHATAGHGLIGT